MADHLCEAGSDALNLSFPLSTLVLRKGPSVVKVILLRFVVFLNDQ